MRHGCPAAFTLWTAAAQSGHLGGGCRFINEDQPCGVKVRLPIEPGPAASLDVLVVEHLEHLNLLDGWLRRRADVLAYCSARPVDGGSGAIYVLLRAA